MPMGKGYKGKMKMKKGGGKSKGSGKFKGNAMKNPLKKRKMGNMVGNMRMSR